MILPGQAKSGIFTINYESLIMFKSTKHDGRLAELELELAGKRQSHDTAAANFTETRDKGRCPSRQGRTRRTHWRPRPSEP